MAKDAPVSTSATTATGRLLSLLAAGLTAAACGASPARLAAAPPAVQPVTGTGSPQAAPARRTVSAGVAGRAVEADLLVTSAHRLSAADLRVIRQTPGVVATEKVDTGVVVLRGHRVWALGVTPASFRRWTPAPTRRSDPLWASIARGELSADFDVSRNLKVPLGSTQTVHGSSLRLGALAAMGLPGYDLTVSADVGHRLGLTRGTALLVSAPTQDLVALRARLAAATPVGVSVALLRADAPSAVPVGGFLSNAQIQSVVQAATAQVGKPYVWGATGPRAFDCSGLVGYAFSTIGLTMPRTSQQLWLSGPHVDPGQAHAGDLLFWANDPADPANIDHVAIYLGNGLMVSAPHTGDIVHIAPVPGQNFRGLVRPDPRRAALIGGPTWRSAATGR